MGDDPSRTITVVSGLPRSGTSLMMQMLEAAGLALATDRQREADADNPKGYYELEAVKGLRRDAAFLADAVGHAVKVVAPLLPSLPDDYDYCVVFMERDLREVLASQRAMLARIRSGEVDADEAALGRAYASGLQEVKAWLAGRENVRTCYVSHRQVLRAPREAAVAVEAFLVQTGVFAAERAMDSAGSRVARMAGVVDVKLHRRRGESTLS